MRVLSFQEKCYLMFEGLEDGHGAMRVVDPSGFVRRHLHLLETAAEMHCCKNICDYNFLLTFINSRKAWQNRVYSSQKSTFFY